MKTMKLSAFRVAFHDFLVTEAEANRKSGMTQLADDLIDGACAVDEIGDDAMVSFARALGVRIEQAAS